MEQNTKQDTEKEILEFWAKNKIYSKSKKKNLKGKKFYMMDGPPYATGHIHMGTALNKISKDIAMRSQRLQGKDVFDRAGYDTHGVPIEFQIEKEIGSRSKQDIEKYGVKNFIDKCKEFATKYIDVMNSEFENLGVWMDFENPYLTLNDEYIETIWGTFKVADEKELLYLGKYPVHICPRCETAVAFNEIEYAKQDDTSVFVKFPLKGKKKTFLIIWTTTPWTLPGNTGVMVNPSFDYQEVETSKGETWIMARELVSKIMGLVGVGYTPKSHFKGKDMKDWKYDNPLAKNIKVNPKNSYRVVLSGRYVNLEEGTGLVHCAPGHGKEDFDVGKENGLHAICPVGMNGLLTHEAGKYAGKRARVVDKEIIEDLEKDNLLVHKMIYSHDYPLCWRCKSALLMVSIPQWFLKISEIQKKILEENEKTNWLPSYMKLRMKAWLEGLSDWPISRKRYWGTPLPIWTCECGERKVVGSKKELEKLSGKKVKSVHKPEIDEITIKCNCGKQMKRVEEVLDVWFDSGVSSWAALNEKEFEKFWPADLNIEGKDQVRGWWNSQMILSQIKFDKKPFDNVCVHGMVLDLGKRKMSKSKGNIISPQDIIAKYSRDYIRYYFAKTSKGDDFAFDEKEFNEIEKVFRVLINVNTFVNQLDVTEKSKLSVEDKWILSRYNNLVKNVIEKYNEFKFTEVVALIEQFLVYDLSRTYIKMIRDRQEETYEVLNEIRIGVLKLIAPICPFISEKIWQELKTNKIVKEESIHLSELPLLNLKLIDEELETEFKIVLEVIEKGLAERDKIQIGLKWPLSRAKIKCNLELKKELKEIIESQLNVKKVEQVNNKENVVITIELDTKITPELEAEGFAREISRKVQAGRKKAGLIKTDLINLNLEISKEFAELITPQLKFIQERTNSKKITLNSKNKYENELEDKIKDKDLKILFSKI